MNAPAASCPANFDPVARPYRALEWLAFGSLLQRARTAHLGQVTSARRALIVGEGDGRFLEAFRKVNPGAEVTVLDGSRRMLELAEARAGRLGPTRFICGDVRAGLPPGPPRPFDLIVTHFVLDCFSQEEGEEIVSALAKVATEEATWLVADFNLPPGGWRRVHAQVWLRTMYTFFGLATKLRTKQLARVDEAISRCGFQIVASREFRWELLRSQCWRRGHAVERAEPS